MSVNCPSTKLCPFSDGCHGVLNVERHIRGKWLCKCCELIVQMSVAPHVIDKGLSTRRKRLVNYPPKVAVSNLVNSLKGVSSRLLCKERPDIDRYWRNMLWSPSYFASSCGGTPIDVIRRYIEQQQTPH